MNDMVNSPKHYEFYPDMDAIEVIRRTLSYQEYIGYLKGNALKYRLRAGEKGDTQQDIDKSNWYRKALRDVLPSESAEAVGADVTPEGSESIPEIPKGGETVIRKGLPENYFKALDACKSSEFEHTREESGDRIKPVVKLRRPIPSSDDEVKAATRTNFGDFPAARLEAWKKMLEVTPEEDEAWDEKRADMIGINGNDGLHYDQAETKLGAHKIDKRGLCVVCGEKWQVGDQITTVCKREFEDAEVIAHKAQSYTRATDSGDYVGGHYGAYFEPSDLSGGPYVFMCDQCGDVIEYGQEVIRVCPGKPCDHTAGFHSLSSTSEKICIDCKEVMPGKDDAKLTTHKRKSGVGPDT